MHTDEEVLELASVWAKDNPKLHGMLLAYADLLEKHEAEQRELSAAKAEVERLREALTNAASDVLNERKRQVEVEGWSTEHDNAHDNGDLACAAASYALHAGCVLNPNDGVGFDGVPPMWPQSWSQDWWNPKNPRRDLVRAAALIIAEIERIDRAVIAATRKDSSNG